VTVCVAALCDGGKRVIGASDRMLTAGDIQFEPQQSKIWPLTTSIVAMYSGDTAILTEILQAVHLEVNKHVREHPELWLRVRDVAEICKNCYWNAHVKRSQSEVLAPLGLNAASFLIAQGSMSQDVVADLTEQMQDWDFSDINSIIFAGVDVDGPQGMPGTNSITYAHIYLAHDAEVTCQDRVGFAAIGIGTSHAESQLMYEGHSSAENFVDTILVTYLAKKRAEIAPGVGKATDMFIIGPGVGSHTTVGDHVLAELLAIHDEHQKEVREARDTATKRMHKFDEELTKKAEEKSGKANTVTQSDAQTSAGQR
jgi:hypothetical protein